MGKAARWFKGLLGMKKEKEKGEGENSNSNPNSDFFDKKERKRWSFGKSGKDTNVLSQIPATDAAWFRSYISESEKEQNKHAIAVAAATAAAADAAVAAAQAAVAVVRLTSNGRGTLFNGGRERIAAVKIQSFFRGYLARKAHRALKGLVRLQALVRGYLVRKRAAATLHSMQALIRAQTAARSQRIRRSNKENHRYQPENRSRRSTEKIDDSRSEILSFDSPKIVEIDTYKPRSRSRRMNNLALSECGDDFSTSPLLCPVPARISVPSYGNCEEYEWCFTGDECRFSTAHNTPRFVNSTRVNAPPTPKSVCGDFYFRPYVNVPSYMANTQSFRAKSRSHSAPKQRPEPGVKKRLSLNEMMAARNSVSGVRMQRSCSHVQEDL